MEIPRDHNNGKDEIYKVETYQLGDIPKEPPVAHRAGYALMGWSTTPKGAKYDFRLPISSDLNLYALWSEE